VKIIEFRAEFAKGSGLEMSTLSKNELKNQSAKADKKLVAIETALSYLNTWEGFNLLLESDGNGFGQVTVTGNGIKVSVSTQHLSYTDAVCKALLQARLKYQRQTGRYE
jgi:hypothetical protein